MKIKYLGETDPGSFIKGKEYKVISSEKVLGKTMYSIIDESGEDYLYSLEDKSKFEISEDKEGIFKG